MKKENIKAYSQDEQTNRQTETGKANTEEKQR